MSAANTRRLAQPPDLNCRALPLSGRFARHDVRPLRLFTMSDLLRFLGEWAHLAWQVVAILALETLAGFAFTAWLLPRFFRTRWLLAAPLVGTALTALVLLPLCLLGFNIAQVWWVPLAAAALAAGMLLLRRRRQLHALWLGAKKCAGVAVGAVLVVTLVSTHYLTSRNTGSTRDLWGCTDFFHYWTMADYLQEYGATMAHYHRQDEYKSANLERHFTAAARLGAIANLAAWARVLSPGDTWRIVNAAIIAGIVSWLFVLRLFLDRERVKAQWPLLLVALHPMLHALLFFSYYSQATAMPVCVLSLMVGAHCLRQARSVRERLAAGVLLGANLLNYATIGAQLAFLGAFAALRRRAWVALLPMGGAALLVCFYYLPQLWTELMFIRRQTVQDGWNWRGLVGLPELLGIAPVAGYSLPASEPDERLAANLFLAPLAAGLLAIAWRGMRQRMELAAVLGGTLLLLAMALRNVSLGVEHATHGVFKILSQFAPFVFVVLLLPIHALLRKRLVRWVPAALAPIFLLWLWLEWRAVDLGAQQRFLFKPDAVEFVREQAAGAPKVCLPIARFGWWQADIFESLLKRPEKLVMKGAEPLWNPVRIEPIAFIYSAELGTPAVSFARSENYRIGTPPGALDFRRPGERMWVQRGTPAFWEKSNRCAITLGPRKSRLVLGYRWKAVQSESKLRVRVNGEVCGEAVITAGSAEASVPVKATEQPGEPYTIVEIDVPPDTKPPTNPIVLDRVSYAD